MSQSERELMLTKISTYKKINKSRFKLLINDLIYLDSYISENISDGDKLKILESYYKLESTCVDSLRRQLRDLINKKIEMFKRVDTYELACLIDKLNSNKK